MRRLLPLLVVLAAFGCGEDEPEELLVDPCVDRKGISRRC